MVEQRAIIIASIALTNEDIKQKDDIELLIQSSHEMEEEGEINPNRPLTIKGLPIESQQYAPLVFLIPHMRQQNFQYSVSFLNISNILLMLLKCSWCDTDALRTEVTRNQLREEDLLRKTLVLERNSSSSSNSPAISPALPKRENDIQNTEYTLTTFTTVNPQNQYKKVVALSKDKELDQ